MQRKRHLWIAQPYSDETQRIYSKFYFKINMLECVLSDIQHPERFWVNREYALQELGGYIKNFEKRSRGRTVPNFANYDERWTREFLSDKELERKNTAYYKETWQMLEEMCQTAIANTKAQRDAEVHQLSLRYCNDACYSIVEKVISLNKKHT